MNKLKSISFREFISYAGIGIMSSVIEWLTNCLVNFVLLKDFKYNIYVAVVAGFIVSVFFSYVCNQAFVFKCKEGEKRNFFKALLKTYMMYFTTGVIMKEFLTWLFVRQLSMSAAIAPVVIILILYPINFLVSKFWAYKPEKADSRK